MENKKTPFLSSNEIRARFIAYFETLQHKEIEAARLIPNGDSSLLFVNSGMFPLVPYLLGEKHPLGNRLVNYQRCFRTDDIDEVGDKRHTTCFEMMGNRSLADYFKKEQIGFRYGFLFDELGIDPSKIYQSTFGGNADVEEDLDSIRYVQEAFAKYGITAGVWPKTTGKWDLWPWVSCDFQTQRIFQYSDKNRRQRGNVIGEVGGPDTETFYDTEKEHDTKYGEYCHPNCDCGRFIEIGNSVFIQYKLTDDGRKQLENANVDFGGGLERITMAVQGYDNVFKTDIFSDYIAIFEKDYGVMYDEHNKDLEVIVDHCRAIVWLIMDGCMISNKDQWYFLRRLIRRVLTKLHVLWVEDAAMMKVVDAIIEKLHATYPEMKEKKNEIIWVIEKERAGFAKNLKNGMHFFEKIVASQSAVTGDDAFLLQTSHGFPIDLIKELCMEKGIGLDIDAYYAKVEEHKNISRAGADKKFKSWLGDDSVQTIQYHTATHVLHQVLRDLFGDEIKQNGSNLTAERLRFDFTCPTQLTKEDIAKTEALVNERLRWWFLVSSEIMNLDDAWKSGAIGLFGEKYPEQVSVYTMIQPSGKIISKEICTGPHIKSAVELWGFRITEYSSLGAEVRRIKAVLE